MSRHFPDSTLGVTSLYRTEAANVKNYKSGSSAIAHLNRLEHVSEHRPLLLLIRLGSVLVAVRGQSVQFIAQLIPVVKLKLLREREGRKESNTEQHEPGPTGCGGTNSYGVHVSGQLKEQRNGLSCSNSHVHVLTLQQPW